MQSWKSFLSCSRSGFLSKYFRVKDSWTDDHLSVSSELVSNHWYGSGTATSPRLAALWYTSTCSERLVGGYRFGAQVVDSIRGEFHQEKRKEKIRFRAYLKDQDCRTDSSMVVRGIALFMGHGDISTLQRSSLSTSSDITISRTSLWTHFSYSSI